MPSVSPEQSADDLQPVSGWRSALLLYVKGIAMGLGDSVPGISGGTIAVITNIYDRLIYSIRAVDLVAVRLLLSGQIKACWQHINGLFLLLVALGILSGLLLSANTVLYLLESHYEALMAFFIGLVLASVWLLKARFRIAHKANWLPLFLGLLCTAAIGLLDAREVEISLLYVFLCGSIAICAMILPGLSGAFILLLLGVYETILRALLAFDLVMIGVFMAGCVSGLLLFSRLLAWMLHNFHEMAYSFICGLLLGSLVVLWPWQQVVSDYVDRHGESHALQTVPVWPLHYNELTGQDPQLLVTLVMLITGAVLVLLVERVFAQPA